MAERLEDAVEEPLDRVVDQAVQSFGDGLANRANATPKELAEDFFDAIEETVDKYTNWCDFDPIPGSNAVSPVMWIPTVTLAAKDDGTLSHSYGATYKHPLLKISDKTKG